MPDGGEADERRTVRYRRPRDSCQSKCSTVPRISHWPRPRRCWIGSAALLLFEPRWWGKAGARSPWIGSGPRLVRAHSQNYRPWRQIDRRVSSTSCWSPRVASLSSAASRLRGPRPHPPPPVPVFSQISTKLGRLAVYDETRKRCRWTVTSVSARSSDKTGGGK